MKLFVSLILAEALIFLPAGAVQINHGPVVKAAGGAFSPSSLTSLYIWLEGNAPNTSIYKDSTNLAAITGDNIDHWTDQSPNAFSFVHSSFNPTYLTGGANSTVACNFSTTLSLLHNTGTNTAQPVTVYLVVGGSNTASKTVFDSWDTSGQVQVNINAGQHWEMNAGSSVAGSGTADANIHVVTAVFNGASSVLRLDGTQIASGNPGSGHIFGAVLGSKSNGGNYYSGYYQACIVQLAVATGTEMSNCEGYLKTKYGTP